jgi:hypothetical protein
MCPSTTLSTDKLAKVDGVTLEIEQPSMSKLDHRELVDCLAKFDRVLTQLFGEKPNMSELNHCDPSQRLFASQQTGQLVHSTYLQSAESKMRN